MSVYQKVDGVWEPAEMVYLKRNNVHTPVIQAYVKVAGVWELAHNYDVVPPDSPEISTEIIDHIVGGKLVGRWIRVGVRGGIVHNSQVRRIRVLTTYNGAMPTSYQGGTFTSASDDNYPTEPWSEFRYNGFGPHTSTATFQYKQWPRNARDTVLVKPGTTYHFAAWSEDFAGNWSPGVTRSVEIPKTTDAANLVLKQTRIQANSSASIQDEAVINGDLLQRWTPAPPSTGMWFYGDQITGSVGTQGTPTIRAAQILINRDANDGGSPSANVYLFWHGYRSQGEVPVPGARVYNEVVKLGTIAKGESKWFAIPASHWPDMNTGIKGFGLLSRDPAKASGFADDFSLMKGVAANLRSGEVYITWQEAL